MEDNLSLFLEELDKQRVWNTDVLKKMLTKSGIAVPNNIHQFIAEIKPGDVFSPPNLGSHPAIVLRIEGEWCLAALMSTKMGPYVAYQLKDVRFFVGSYVSFTLLTAPIGLVKARYLGSVDSNAEVRNAISAIKQKTRQMWRKKKKIEEIIS